MTVILLSLLGASGAGAVITEAYGSEVRLVDRNGKTIGTVAATDILPRKGIKVAIVGDDGCSPPQVRLKGGRLVRLNELDVETAGRKPCPCPAGSEQIASPGPRAAVAGMSGNLASHAVACIARGTKQ